MDKKIPEEGQSWFLEKNWCTHNTQMQISNESSVRTIFMKRDV